MTKYPLGALPSKTDNRDYHISKLIPVKKIFPEEFEINVGQRMINQYNVGACVSCSLTLTKEIQEKLERDTYIKYSIQFIYNNRASTDYQKSGMYPREALKRLKEYGVCREILLPGIKEYPNNIKSTEQMFKDAESQKITAYARIYNVDEIKSALMQLGPVSITIPVYDSFYYGGKLNLPDTKKEFLYGYHQITILGWRKGNHWLIQNSWSENWGDLKGFCLMPFNYPIVEQWSITDYINPNPKPQPEPDKETKIMKMNVPMQVIPPGHTVLGFRSIYEALNGKVEWGYTKEGKIWAKATIPPTEKEIVIETIQDSDEMKIIK